MQSVDSEPDKNQTTEAKEGIEVEIPKRPAEDVLPSTESKRPRLTNGDNKDNGNNAEHPVSESVEAVNDKEGQNDVTNTRLANDEATEAADANSTNMESPSKISLPGNQSETSVVVISEGDDEEAAAAAAVAGDDEVETVDDDDDDDDDDCQIVGVSHRVPAMPRSDVEYVQHLRDRGLNPRDLLTSLIGSDMSGFQAPEEALWQLLLRLVTEPTRRKRLENVSTLDDVVVLLSTCQRVLVLTGAGVSVSCGIPDFRSRDGIYARLATQYPELPDPHSMFDISYFRQDQRPFFKFAKEIYPGLFKPSPSHRFIRALEERGRLLRNYSQNIDTLERSAGIQRVLNCHGSFATASCMRCKHKVDSDVIKDDIMNERIPMCPKCSSSDEADKSKDDAESAATTSPSTSSAAAAAESAPTNPAVLKPDIVFFGESLPVEFYDCISQDESQADLLIVIGSSLKVQPVSLIPSSLPSRVPQILINREPLHQHNFDVCLLGDCDRIVAELCRRLGWEGVADEADGQLSEIRGEELLERRRLAYAAAAEQSSDKAAKDAEKPAVDAASASTSGSTTAGQVEHPGPSSSSEPSSSSAAVATVTEAAESDASATPHEDDCNLSAYLPDGAFARFPPNKYVFPGAEAHPDEICSEDEEADYDEDDEEDDDDDDEEEFDDEDEEDLTDYEEPGSPVVVNLVSSDEDNEDEEILIEEEAEQPADEDRSIITIDDNPEAGKANEATAAMAESSSPPVESATVPSPKAPAAGVGGVGEIGDAEEDELLNCDVD